MGTRETIGTLLRYYRGNGLRWAASLFLIAVQAAALYPVARLTRSLFEQAIPQERTSEVVVLLGALLLVFTISALAALANRHLTLDLNKAGIEALRRDLLREALFHDRRPEAQADVDGVHVRIVHDSERVDCMVSAFLTRFLPGVLTASGMSIILAFLNPSLFLVVAVVLAALYFSTRQVGRKVREAAQAFRADFSDFSKGVAFVLKHGDLIRFSAHRVPELARQVRTVSRLRTSSHRVAWLATAHTVLQGYWLAVAGIITLLAALLPSIRGGLSVGSLLSFYVTLSVMAAQARSAAGAVPTLIDGWASLCALAPLLAIPEDGPKSPALPPLRDRVTLEGVSIRFGRHFDLEGANLEVRVGEVVGLFGPSGSGKSTLLRVLLGLEQPRMGAVRVDGVDLRDVDPDSWRSQIGTLPQDPTLFPGTIRENLVYGLAEVPGDDAIADACDRAGILQDFRRLEAGLETDAGEMGSRLSGGQRQRLALARAVLRRPRLLLLDEPDNNLEEATVRRTFGALRRSGQATLVVTHDRTFLPMFDRAYEIRVEEGRSTVEELPTPTPRVSVVMPVFNAERYVAAAIDSVLAQSHPDLELVCVNDGSTDGSREILRSYGNRITVVELPANAGAAAARNEGIRRASGSFVAFLDADDLWSSPAKIEGQLRRLREDPSADVCLAWTECFVSPELPPEVRARRDCPAEPQLSSLPSAVLVRRRAFDRVGHFDAGLRVGEFVDWLIRARDAGLTTTELPGVVVRRRIHDANVGVTRRDARADFLRIAREHLQRSRDPERGS